MTWTLYELCNRGRPSIQPFWYLEIVCCHILSCEEFVLTWAHNHSIYVMLCNFQPFKQEIIKLKVIFFTFSLKLDSSFHGIKAMDRDPFTSPLTITQCVTLKLNDLNYLSWKFQFEQFLNSQTLLGYVNGVVVCPPPTISVRNGDLVTETPNPEHAIWVRTYQRIMAWLVGSLSEDVINSVYGLRMSQ